MSFPTYIRQHIMLLLVGIFCCAFPGALLALSEETIWNSNGLYGIFVTGFIFCIYILVDYGKERQFCKKLDSLTDQKGLDFVVALPEPVSTQQKLYTRLLQQLKANADQALYAFEEQKEEDMEFVETWVHEVKTPIAAAKLIIENQLDEPTEQTLYELLDEIQNIEDMIQKTICYSQLNDFSKDCQLSDVNVEKMVNRCIRQEYANLQNKKVQLKLENLDFTVNSDEKWLGFMVKQILDNAIKYSKTGGKVAISGINEAYNQRIQIRDFGIGIRAEDVRKVFEKGYTGRNGRKKDTATGIGLYLSHKLAQKLEHEIKISSETGKGTLVEIILRK